MQLPPIVATTIGSFPRPSWLAQNELSCARYFVEGAALKEAQDDATALSIHTQERIGLDLLSDGEQRRTGFINHILAAFDGIDLEHEAVKQIYRRREQPRPVPRVVGKIKRRAPAIVEDLRFAKAQTGKTDQNGRAGPDDSRRQHARRALQGRGYLSDGRRGGTERRAARIHRLQGVMCWRSMNPP